jgi:hypothetical protein
VLELVVARYRDTVKRLYFRGDAAFANPEIYEFLEAECMAYAIRLPANSILQSKIGYLIKRPVGRPPHELRRYFASFSYQAQSWGSRFISLGMTTSFLSAAAMLLFMDMAGTPKFSR